MKYLLHQSEWNASACLLWLWKLELIQQSGHMPSDRSFQRESDTSTDMKSMIMCCESRAVDRAIQTVFSELHDMCLRRSAKMILKCHKTEKSGRNEVQNSQRLFARDFISSQWLLNKCLLTISGRYRKQEHHFTFKSRRLLPSGMRNITTAFLACWVSEWK